MSEKTSLYRHYDADGTLLYVGISLSPIVRLQTHSYSSNWFEQIARIDVQWYETRTKAMAAERKAIRKEKPKFNKTHIKHQLPVTWTPYRREKLEKLSSALEEQIDLVGPEKAAEILSRLLEAITSTYGTGGSTRFAIAATALKEVGPKKEPVSIQSYGNFKAERWHGVLDDLIEKAEADE